MPSLTRAPNVNSAYRPVSADEGEGNLACRSYGAPPPASRCGLRRRVRVTLECTASCAVRRLSLLPEGDCGGLPHRGCRDLYLSEAAANAPSQRVQRGHVLGPRWPCAVGERGCDEFREAASRSGTGGRPPSEAACHVHPARDTRDMSLAREKPRSSSSSSLLVSNSRDRTLQHCAIAKPSTRCCTPQAASPPRRLH